jgi:transposase
LKTRLIAEARIKTDSIDSESLAYLLKADLIAKSYVPPKEIREQRRIARHRASLVKIRTIVKNMIHALLARNGIKHSFSDLFGKAGIEFLRSLELDEESRFELNQYLVLLRVLSYKIEETQELVEDIAEQNYYAKLLISVPGISYLSALVIAGEIADVSRFGSSKALASYAGLVPSTYQSGNKSYHGSITKQGSVWLRWILIQAANKAVESNKHLRKFYLRIAKKKGHNVAVVAVARKLLRYIWVMLSYGLTFDALRINKG